MPYSTPADSESIGSQALQVTYMHIKVWEALDYTILHHKHLLIDQLIDNTHVDDSQEFHEF